MRNTHLSFNSLFSLIVLVVILTNVSCKRTDNSGFSDKPVYLKIDDITVSSDEQKFGAGTDNITDAWVFVDDQQIGVFELPCEAPVLPDGNRNIKVYGGIKRNGIARQRTQYEFYSSFDLDTDLIAEKTYDLKPNVTYSPSTNVIWKENFEDISTLVDSNTFSKVPITRISEPSLVKTGLYSGEVLLTKENNEAIIQMTDLITIPKFVPSYLEIDYRSNIDLKISMNIHLITGVIVPTEVLTIRASDLTSDDTGWKKMYVFLAPTVGATNDAEQFRVYFSAELPNELDNGYIYLDNLKIVH